MENLRKYLEKAVNEQASDIFVVAGAPISAKIDGRIVPIDTQKLLPPDTEALIREFFTLADRSISRYLEIGDDDFSFAIAGLARFRVNTYKQRNSLAAVIRVVSFDIPNFQNINIPRLVSDRALTTLPQAWQDKYNAVADGEELTALLTIRDYGSYFEAYIDGELAYTYAGTHDITTYTGNGYGIRSSNSATYKDMSAKVVTTN